MLDSHLLIFGQTLSMPMPILPKVEEYMGNMDIVFIIFRSKSKKIGQNRKIETKYF